MSYIEENKFVFNPDKVSNCSVDLITPNKWNPKKPKGNELFKIRESLRINGLMKPIVVREVGNGYEIIDGEQRYKLWKELGNNIILIYNEGKVDEETAKKLTLWYDVKVPFNEVKLAPLVTFIRENSESTVLPFSEEKMEKFVTMSNNPMALIEPKADNRVRKEYEVVCPECGEVFIITA